MLNTFHKMEKLAYPLIALYLLVGMAFALTVPDYYTLNVAQEDGVVEWLTVIALLLSFFVCVARVKAAIGHKNKLFITVWAFLALVCFFGAGEEISWGQRIFNVESSEWFKANNAQAETNLHNLVVEGKKVNKIIFSMLFGLSLITYLVVFTTAYRMNVKFRAFCDYLGVPIAKIHHVLAWVTVAIIIELIIKDISRSSELFESAAAFVFLLNISFPYNSHIFENNDK